MADLSSRAAALPVRAGRVSLLLGPDEAALASEGHRVDVLFRHARRPRPLSRAWYGFALCQRAKGRRAKLAREDGDFRDVDIERRPNRSDDCAVSALGHVRLNR